MSYNYENPGWQSGWIGGGGGIGLGKWRVPITSPAPAEPTPVPPPLVVPEQPPGTAFSSVSYTSSAYGAQIPIIYASYKITGNVIWASNIRTTPIPPTSDPNAPGSYQSVDFALALCEGTINGILRMWIGDRLVLDQTVEVDGSGIAQADDNGVIGSTTVDVTDPESPLALVGSGVLQTKITVFNGSETQLPRGRIVEVEGFEGTPAYRGIAYILFENFVVSSESLPAISVEISANTEATLPHIVAEEPASQDLFDAILDTVLVVDVAHDTVFTGGRDFGSTSSEIAGARGYWAWENNTLTPGDQNDVYITQSVPDINIERVLMLPSGLWVIQDDGVTNCGPFYTYNPFSGYIVDSFGAQSTSFLNSATTLASQAQSSCAMPTPSKLGRLLDTYCAVGYVATGVAFFQIDEFGKIIDGAPQAYFNGVFPVARSQACGLYVSSSLAQSRPQFYDAVSTPGYHFYFFNVTGGTTLNIYRCTVGNDTVGEAFASAAVDLVQQVSITTLAGDLVTYSVGQVMVDPVDGCFIVPFYTSGTFDAVVKYNPYTGTFGWIAKIAGKMLQNQASPTPRAALSRQKWTFICDDGSVKSINLGNGDVSTVTSSLTDSGLPGHTGLTQFYNGYEDSVVYLGYTAPDVVLVKFFGNRVQRSTVELSTVAKNLLERCGLGETDTVVSDIGALTIDGYAITDTKSLRDVFSELAQVFTFDLVESNGLLLFKARGGASAVTVPHKRLGYVNAEGWLPEDALNDFTNVRKVNLSYRDIDREYAVNQQSVVLPDHNGLDFENSAANDVSVPVVLTADSAKTLAEILLYSKITYQTQFELILPTQYMWLDPADVITVARDDAATELEVMRVRSIEIGADNQVRITASREEPSIYTDTVTLFGNQGRFEESRFAASSIRVDPVVLDIPWLSYDEQAYAWSDYYMALTWLPSNTDANLAKNTTVMFDDGLAPVSVLGPGSDFPTWGIVVEPLEDRGSFFSVDEDSVMTVRMRNVSLDSALDDLASIDAMVVDDGLNLAYVGGELIQFQSVTSLGRGVYEFRNFVRGKFGTDPLIGGHVTGERFILLKDADGVTTPAYRSAHVSVGSSPFHNITLDTGVRDPRYPVPRQYWKAKNYEPWSVADLEAAYDGDDVDLTWERRTRFGGAWASDGSVIGGSVPLNEPTEEYTVYFYRNPTTFKPSDSSTYIRKVKTTTPGYTYLLADQTADLFDNTVDDLYVSVAQTGGHNGVEGVYTQVILPHL